MGRGVQAVGLVLTMCLSVTENMNLTPYIQDALIKEVSFTCVIWHCKFQEKEICFCMLGKLQGLHS